ncbi:uncharacterized protein DSM5745_10675 [Aspergillus mulundensis]|uniref:Exonuclease domain-containing protein n=1 Tax=Aspergillus mulundensis TaxID=1810919 RepID=A0A3D8QHG0_9EURO|nr:hypothetical protein DSM5745_10675 [Aspergillus mulundensis]RDW61177.1 hypothetical protein DSM5745_10675 [Aspergillus mulundensis]
MAPKRARPADPTYRDTGPKDEADVDVDTRPTKRARGKAPKQANRAGHRKAKTKIDAVKKKTEDEWKKKHPHLTANLAVPAWGAESDADPHVNAAIRDEAKKHNKVQGTKTSALMAGAVRAAIVKEAKKATKAACEARKNAYNAVKALGLCDFDQQRAGIRQALKGAHVQALETAEEITKDELKELKEHAAKAYMKAQSIGLQLGHPFAARNGGWTLLREDQQDELLHQLMDQSHSEADLAEAKFPMPGRFGFARAPAGARDPNKPKKRVVALDCEFVKNAREQSMLAQLVVVDMLTGKVLDDVLVDTPEPIADYATEYSGLTPATYDRYRKLDLVLPNVAAAQAALFEHIDDQTIIVGYAVHNDFEQLKLCHTRVVDPQLLIRRAVENKYGRDFGARLQYLWKLKHLMVDLVGRYVQLSKKGHDCVEDAFAARELVIWWLAKENAKPVRRWVRMMARDQSRYLGRTPWLHDMEWTDRLTPDSEDSEANPGGSESSASGEAEANPEE